MALNAPPSPSAIWRILNRWALGLRSCRLTKLQPAILVGIRAELYRVGAPIGPYDMMIAGQARASGLVLVSNNVKEFEKVPGLMLENWVR